MIGATQQTWLMFGVLALTLWLFCRRFLQRRGSAAGTCSGCPSRVDADLVRPGPALAAALRSESTRHEPMRPRDVASGNVP